MHEFRRNDRDGVDVLLVDAVQLFAGKESTQDELFHTFNALHGNHEQIVPPRTASRMRSRSRGPVTA